MQLRVLAPTVVDHTTVPGAAVREPERYARFWTSQQEPVDRLLHRLAPAPAGQPGTEPAPPVVRLEHVRPASAANRYRVISDLAVDLPVHVLTGSLRPEHLPEAFAGRDPALCGGVREITLRLHDHGILLVELLVDVDAWLAGREEPLEECLDLLQDAAVALGAAVAREAVHRYLDPVLALLREADRGDDVLAPAARPGDGAGLFGEVLWVTRSLVVGRADADCEAVVRHWLKDVAAVRGEQAPPVERLVTGEIDHLARWLNYVFLDGSAAGGTMLPGQRFTDSWEAMRYAQFFYAALDVVDTRLSKILADSAAATARWELAQLQEQLVGLSRRAELVVMDRQALAKHLKRAVRVEMDQILDLWDYAELVEAPVLFKIGICDRRLAELAARRTARSSLVTDLILLGIGVTSVLGTALALSDFGRTMASDPGMARYDIGRNSVTAWFAAQPADALLLISATVSAALVVLYLLFRRNHGR
ncbi:hypothetical protein GCU60_02265 [Blastococcus saxobsidens]|uniref:Uncharacterized protein n=1 Tax=Blastococcus saxobsidens TaxID=138336 RepID=A0A6L9VYG0_9ACTN|nr:hypothetical protein [Blastococcus saxobsidens]NEK84592.1 hypothetical protein [Blastococcus saxobsidens]